MRPTEAPAWGDRLSFGALAVAVGLLAVLAWRSDFAVVERFRGELTGSFLAFLSIESFAGVGVILLLERLIPARPMQRSLSPSLVMDALYVLVQLPLLAVSIAFLTYPIEAALQRHAGFLVLDPLDRLPWPATLVLALLVSDLILWSAHVAKHKVPFLWRFHVIHHSQEQLNLFTANRTHPVDSLFEHLIGVVPAFLLFPSVVQQGHQLILFGLAMAWYIRFQHANIRLGLGPLRYVFVTPQSHRIHHSADPEHWNTNFANIFCWDRLVGLQHPDHTSYPATGVRDPQFPEPASFAPRDLVGAYASQLAYPFDRRRVQVASLGDAPELLAMTDPGLAA